MPLTKVTTAITAATPMTTPSKVSAERSLSAHNDRNAILIASVMFIGSGRRSQVLGLRLEGIDISPLTPRMVFSLTAQPWASATWRVRIRAGGIYRASVLCWGTDGGRGSREPALSGVEGSSRAGTPALHYQVSHPARGKAHREFHRHKRHQQRQHGPDRRRLYAATEDRWHCRRH